MESKLKVRLIGHTPNPDKIVAEAAKLCYSPVGVDEIDKKLTEEKIQEFVRHLVDIGHESPLEHCTFTFAIEGISRTCSHQIVRHRIASFCLSGDTVVGYDNKIKGITIKELYEKPDQYRNMIKLRSVNEDTQEIILNKIENIVFSGNKKVYEVTTKDGYKIKATELHKFYTEDGWKMLKDISVGEKVYVIGEAVKCVKPSEIISIKEVGNEDTYDIEMKAPYHNFIANGFVVHNSQQSQRYVKLDQFDYIIPPAIADIPAAKQLYIKQMEEDQQSYNTLVEILISNYIEKDEKHKMKLVIKELAGENYNKDMVDYWNIPMCGPTSRECVARFKEVFKKEYSAIEKKAIEDARYVFPNACETKMVETFNARSLINFFNRRCCNRAQWEIRELADEMLKQVKEVAPIIFANAGAPCEHGKCPEGSMSCKTPRRR